jgi:hypothetical protein
MYAKVQEAINDLLFFFPPVLKFFVPSNPTYWISEAIPFHIQISSSLGTLRELFLPSTKKKGSGHVLQPQDTNPKSMGREEATMRVYIARDITVKMRGKKASRTAVVGSGMLRPVPPTDLGGTSTPCSSVCLDWEGEVKCSAEVRCGGFDVGYLDVKVGKLDTSRNDVKGLIRP